MAGKITKEELKEPDKFQVILSQVVAYMTRNRRKLYLAGMLITVILLISGGWYLYDLEMEKNAQRIYDRSLNIAAGDTTVAVEIYKEVLEKYPRSHAAALSHYRLAALFYHQKDFDAAIRHYEAFINQAPDRSDIKTIAYMGMGHCHEAKKDFKNALIAFEKAAESKAGQVFSGLNNQNIARIYEAMNERAKALEYYQKALAGKTDPTMELLLKRKIATLS